MPRFDEYNYDELIKESERILGDVVAPGTVQTQAASEATQARQELASLRAAESESADGCVDVQISEDRMMAVASFYPPVGAGKLIELIEVQELLIAKGLRFGIDWEKLKSFILSCNTSRRANCGVEVARGRRPSDEISPRLEIEASLLRREAPENPAAQTVDFRAISPFRFVKKGDTLARITPRIKGVAGIDVTGAVVAYGSSSAHSPKPGKNTQVDEGVVVAQCDGRFVASDSSFWVSEVLQIRGDVDFSTGHIDFAGDVIIQGQIKQGFKVKAGGSLSCAKLIDASEISCGGDLETGQGILGRMQGTVKVGGSVRAKFIENCYVEAGGDVFVSTGCLNSVINTLGAVSMGPKGVIIGGKLNAQKGVSAFQIGSNAEVRTEIYCGMDYTVQKKLTWIRDRNIELALKLKKIEATLASRQNPLLLELRDKLKAAIRKMNDSAKTLIASLDKNEEASVVAKGDIHHGVYVEICHVPLVVSNPLSRVRLTLDKTFGVIFPEKLGRV
jgi:hypothetical protein